ncbi:MAG: DUF5915 domain-containing protein, partial [Anaerolineae bacterium]
DQTRGWFYSLHAISTVLFEQPCFKNVICLGHILDENGQKMSKSRGNVVKWEDVVSQHGADALRWYMYTASPPGNPRRFSLDLVGAVVREFLLTLWNTYAFFVTYANIDGFDPTKNAVPVAERSELDRWVLAELHSLVQSVDAGLAQYDVSGAARPIERFVNNLSNWYVRRSRRRFWKSETDQDKAAAYLTLYECLVTVAKLLAPFAPFIAEEMYRNLVVSVDAAAPQSVHFCDFPVADASLIDAKLQEDMALAMRMVSLGHGARNSAGIKLRQPLRRAVVALRTAEEAEALRRLEPVILEELNVKQLEVAGAAAELVSYAYDSVPARLGPKFGKLYPAVRRALQQASGPEMATELQAGRNVTLTVEGQEVVLEPEDVQVRSLAGSGLAIGAEAGYVVGIETVIDEDLRLEGLAREVVRRIQSLRKDSGFRIEDYIITYYEADAAVAGVFVAFADYVGQETLSRELRRGAAPDGAATAEFDVDGAQVRLGLVRV